MHKSERRLFKCPMPSADITHKDLFAAEAILRGVIRTDNDNSIAGVFSDQPVIKLNAIFIQICTWLIEQ